MTRIMDPLSMFFSDTTQVHCLEVYIGVWVLFLKQLRVVQNPDLLFLPTITKIINFHKKKGLRIKLFNMSYQTYRIRNVVS